MQSVISLLNVIFSALTASVNKAFRKSQRATLEFQIPYLTDFARNFAAEGVENMDGRSLRQQLTALGKGSGLYTVYVSIVAPYGTLDLTSTFSDGIGTGSTLIVDYNSANGSVAIISAIKGTKQVLDVASNTAQQKADNAKDAAISAAAQTAQAKADQAKDAAISAAAQTAQAKADQAKDAAIAAAAQTAQAKADQAKDAAKDYTDLEVGKLKLAAKKGWGFSRWVGLVTGFNPATELGTIQGTPLVSDVNGELGMNYLVRIELKNSAGDLIQDTESVLQVEKGLDGDGKMITEEIIVSTEDELLFTVTEGLNGEKHLSFVEKQDVTVLELYKKLSNQIQTHVSESELETALEAQRASILAALDADLI